MADPDLAVALRATRRAAVAAALMWVFVGLTGLFLLIPFAVWTGIDGSGDTDAALGGLILGFLGGGSALAARAWWRGNLRIVERAERNRPVPGPPVVLAPPRPALPPLTSRAHQPVLALARAEVALAEVLDLLDTEDIPARSVERTRVTAAEAATALRAVATRLQAIERAREVMTGAEDRAALTESVQALHQQLENGLTGFRALVAAAGQTLAAAPAVDRADLTDAADHLAAMAAALRELSTP